MTPDRCTPPRSARRVARLAGGLAAAVAVMTGVAACSGEPGPPPPPPPSAPAQAATACTQKPTAEVRTANELVEALAGAHPGAVISMEPGTYAGRFKAGAQGTPDKPIALCGSRDAILDGGDTDDGYTFHLDGGAYWQLDGFTVRGGQKGVMADRAQGNVIESLLVEGTGDEAIHLRQNSTDNVVRDNTVQRTGLHSGKYGEGIYIGSAESNWCDQTNCEPDRSDRNVIEGNTISETTAESVDIKEGTTGGTLRGNTFSGAGMTDADSWVDVKGNGWLIVGNVGTDSPEDGFQVHAILDGWGLDNTFESNTATVNSDGYAINVTKNKERNRVSCDNRSIDAGRGLSPEACG